MRHLLLVLAVICITAGIYLYKHPDLSFSATNSNPGRVERLPSGGFKVTPKGGVWFNTGLSDLHGVILHTGQNPRCPFKAKVDGVEYKSVEKMEYEHDAIETDANGEISLWS